METESLSLVNPLFAISLSNGLCKCAPNRPLSFINPIPKSTTLYTSPLRPFGKCEGFSLISYVLGIASITGLLFSCAPSAIPWVISLIVVYTVKGLFFRRARAHILIERLKRASPSLTYINASTPVGIIGRMILVFTPLNHPTPNIVLGRSGHTVGGGRFDDCFCNLFLVIATAAFRMPCCQAISTHRRTVAAIANTTPIRFSVFDVGKTNYKKTSISATYQVVDALGNEIRLVISHFATSVCILVRKALGRYRVRRFSYFTTKYR